jgi:murein DD-endopeptidase MepM/ murein hydrolase activator NlpD
MQRETKVLIQIKIGPLNEQPLWVVIFLNNEMNAIKKIVFVIISALIIGYLFGFLQIAYFFVFKGEEPVEYIMPVQGVQKSQLVSTFGAPRSNNRKHKGIDIFAARGTPVLASVNSVIVRFTPEERGQIGGNWILTLGEGRMLLAYSHLERFEEGLKKGQIVKAGEVLGYVGNTGNARSTPPHLHFGMFKSPLKRVAVDPYDYLVR